VVILTTSNITERIDVAFVDRADIRQYIGPPSAAAIFKIYLSCLEELMRVPGAVSCFPENTLAFSWGLDLLA
jgi:SpoVK/Ycf46/Vps4 family AAA+-type ATPase